MKTNPIRKMVSRAGLVSQFSMSGKTRAIAARRYYRLLSASRTYSRLGAEVL